MKLNRRVIAAWAPAFVVNVYMVWANLSEGGLLAQFGATLNSMAVILSIHMVTRYHIRSARAERIEKDLYDAVVISLTQELKLRLDGVDNHDLRRVLWALRSKERFAMLENLSGFPLPQGLADAVYDRVKLALDPVIHRCEQSVFNMNSSYGKFGG